MKNYFTLLVALFCSLTFINAASIKGQLQDTEGNPVAFANVTLYAAADSSITKVEVSNDAGIFQMEGIAAGDYYIIATYVGLPNLEVPAFTLTEDQAYDLGVVSFQPQGLELSQVTVTAMRPMVEVKPDRTVFNVQGTINSVGENALELLRKAPGVMVDNNDNVTVLGRAGVLVYVDGKRLPLSGDDLSNYLQNLQADQIDRFDIITNPGARYEAEGNAGIIDIRLKKDKNLGTNGTISGTVSQGDYARYNASASGNYRNKKTNIFGSLGHSGGDNFNNMRFSSFQNGLFMTETNNSRNDWLNYNLRLGTDFFLSKEHTLGFLVSANQFDGGVNSINRVNISQATTPDVIDSILVANNNADNERRQQTFNLNYRYATGKRSLNIDLDYGNYVNESIRDQPNLYYDAKEENLLTSVINAFDTPTDIDIYTATIDYEDELWGGKIGFGSKLSRVDSDNTFQIFNVVNDVQELDKTRSNQFDYTENVYAGYISYNRPINQKWSFSAGLRSEITDASGFLQVFDEAQQDSLVELNYTSWFPNAGLTWQVAQQHTLNLNYGRRINRPDYNVLNPFENRLSELSFEKGNPRLNPEIVNNIELGYTLAYRYNFKLAYSRTTDQITRLIAPDDRDERAGFITWANLADQTVINFTTSAPIQVNKWWNMFTNFSVSYLDNQADYGDGAVVDVQAWTYNIYQQHTFNLPAGFRGEISGWFSGPGVWGGVFEYETSWSLNVGVQRRFLNDQLNVRLSANDLFYETGWDGISSFDGLESTGSGRWDSRRVSLSLSYNFGNQNVKRSRRRSTGIEAETNRLSGGN